MISYHPDMDLPEVQEVQAIVESPIPFSSPLCTLNSSQGNHNALMSCWWRPFVARPREIFFFQVPRVFRCDSQ